MATSQTDYSPGFFLPQAKAWADQAGAMGQASSESTALQINGGNMWPFDGAVAAYNKMCAQFSTWTAEGVNQMMAICDALCESAQRYGATEQQLIQASDGTWNCR